MVYTGRPSSGCLLCIKRRLNCDGGRPGCQRCVRYKVECPGYRNDEDFKFVSENLNVQVKTWRQKGNLLDDKDFGRHASATNELDVSDSNLRQVSPATAIQQAWDNRCISLFFYEWVIPANDGLGEPGYMSFLPDFCAAADGSSGLRSAVQAAAYAFMTCKPTLIDLTIKARAKYGEALSAITAMIQDPIEAVKDATIVAVMVLQIFENITSDKYHAVKNHDAGIRMLLTMRGDAQFETPIGRTIFRMAATYLRMRSVNTRLPLPPTLRAGFDKLGMASDDPFYQLNDISFRIVDTCSAIDNFLFNRSDPSTRQISCPDIANNVQLLDQEYDRWASALPLTWCHTELGAYDDAHGHSLLTLPSCGAAHVYRSIQLAVWRNTIRVLRMIMHRRVLQMAQNLGFVSEHYCTSQSMLIMNEMADEILSNAAFCLGEVDVMGIPLANVPGRAAAAYMMLWPHVAMSINPHLGDRHREDAYRVLDFIGKVMGIRRGLQSNDWRTINERGTFRQDSMSPPACPPIAEDPIGVSQWRNPPDLFQTPSAQAHQSSSASDSSSSAPPMYLDAPLGNFAQSKSASPALSIYMSDESLAVPSYSSGSMHQRSQSSASPSQEPVLLPESVTFSMTEASYLTTDLPYSSAPSDMQSIMVSSDHHHSHQHHISPDEMEKLVLEPR